jgi:hypothetical protein
LAGILRTRAALAIGKARDHRPDVTRLEIEETGSAGNAGYLLCDYENKIFNIRD